MKIKKIIENRRRYMDLLLIADEQEDMIEKYIDLGDMFTLYEGTELIGECIVIPLEEGVYELKNIAIYEMFRRRGYGKRLINYTFEYYSTKIKTMYVGTGDSPLSIPFYKDCGFLESHRVKNFFIDNYDHPIIEGGEQLRDMVYLKREFN